MKTIKGFWRSGLEVYHVWKIGLILTMDTICRIIYNIYAFPQEQSFYYLSLAKIRNNLTNSALCLN